MHSYSEFATKKNATSAKVKAMIYPGADILNAISLYDNSWGQTYSSSDYTDEKVADICRYAANEYSCRASCTYTIRNGSSGKDYDFAFINSYPGIENRTVTKAVADTGNKKK